MKNKLNVGLSWSTLNEKEHDEKNVPLYKFSEIFKMVLIGYSGTRNNMIH